MRGLATVVCLFASVAGIAYLAFALRRVLAFGRRRATRSAGHLLPAVTMLKPLCGAEPELYENLCSFCDQDYPLHQIIFGVRDEDDPAITVAKSVIESFPDRDVTLVVDQHARGSNFKIANVLNMMDAAKHDILVIADSDARVDSGYLRSIVAPFTDEAVGAVTCLYSGTPSGRLDSRPLHDRSGDIVSALGAMFINDQFAPSVLVAVALGPMDFCLGATMAVRRKLLEKIGGFEALSSYLADDQMLGKLVSDSGFLVELCPYVVESIVCEPSFRSLWLHELRWARTMFTAHPLGYTFSFITYAVPLALTYLLISRNAIAGITLVGLAASLRIALHYVVRNVLEVRAPDMPWLIPIRDVLGLAVWAASFLGRGVQWRERDFSIDGGGRMSVKPRNGPVG